MVYEPEVLPAIEFTAIELQEATWTSDAVSKLLAQINSGETLLRTSLAQLGTVLLKVRTKKYWHAWGFPSFGAYIDSIKNQVGKGRTQLYQTIGVADKLLPFVTPDELANIGISKAILLKQSVEKTGKTPSDEILDQAQDPKVDAAELKALLFKNSNGSPENGQETYFDLGGFYTTKEEKEEILRTFDVATKTDPVISNEIPEWARRKEIIQRLCMNYLAEYEALVAKGQA
jgi:hypothetical protein